jgi:hypothetical protein
VVFDILKTGARRTPPQSPDGRTFLWEYDRERGFF